MRKTVTTIPDWFDITNYSEQEFSDYQLINDLMQRSHILHELTIDNNYKNTKEFKKYSQEIRSKGLVKPLCGKEIEKNVMEAISNLAKEIRDEKAKVSPLWAKVNTIGAQLLTSEDVRTLINDFESLPGTPNWEEYPTGVPYDAVVHNVSKPQVFVTLNLKQPDQVILEDIQSLLQLIREERELTPASIASRGDDLFKARIYRTLPHCDLEIWGVENDIKLSNNKLMQALAIDAKPDWGYDNFRKTALKHFRKMTNPTLLNSLKLR